MAIPLLNFIQIPIAFSIINIESSRAFFMKGDLLWNYLLNNYANALALKPP